MKKTYIPLLIGLAAAIMVTSCSWDVRFGGGHKSATNSSTNNSVTKNDETPVVGQQITAPTLGQQLMDLQKAKDSGAITDAEYQAQKAKLLESK